MVTRRRFVLIFDGEMYVFNIMNQMCFIFIVEHEEKMDYTLLIM